MATQETEQYVASVTTARDGKVTMSDSAGVTQTSENLGTLLLSLRSQSENNVAKRGLTALGIIGSLSGTVSAAAFGTLNITSERAIPELVVEAGLTLAGIIAAKGLSTHLKQLENRSRLLRARWLAALNERYRISSPQVRASKAARLS